MGTVTKPLLLDETGRRIAAALEILAAHSSDIYSACEQAAQSANEAAAAALAAVVTAELPVVAVESDIRSIVTGYADNRTPHK